MEDTSEVSKNVEHEFIYLLIELNCDHPELWKVKSRGCYNQNKKSAVFDRILRAVKTLEPDSTISKLKKKINDFRTNLKCEFFLFSLKRKQLHTRKAKSVLDFISHTVDSSLPNSELKQKIWP